MLPPNPNRQGSGNVNKIDIEKPYSKFVVPVLLGGEATVAQVDTGADYTVVNEKFYWDKVKGPDDEVDPSTMTMHDCNHRELATGGIASLKVVCLDDQQQRRVVEIAGVLVKELGSRVLLGRDFVRKAGLRMDGTNGRVTIPSVPAAGVVAAALEREEEPKPEQPKPELDDDDQEQPESDWVYARDLPPSFEEQTTVWMCGTGQVRIGKELTPDEA